MSIWTTIADDLDAALDDFGESVVYYPASGTQRTISAVVDRQPRESLPDAQRGASSPITVTVKNDAAEGITSTEINLRGDSIELYDRLGDTAVTRHKIVGMRHDAAVLVLELR